MTTTIKQCQRFFKERCFLRSNTGAVAGAECNTVIDLKSGHHAA